ncbi:MAG TPA: GxxExxY protein [Pirellulales bacterium]|nr:GxxExxY protein [Pirellulales bacterium]
MSGERDPLTHEVIGAAMEVHREMGPGLLESVYQKCLERELQLRTLSFESQARLPLIYKGMQLDEPLVMDFYFPGRLAHQFPRPGARRRRQAAGAINRLEFRLFRPLVFLTSSLFFSVPLCLCGSIPPSAA